MAKGRVMVYARSRPLLSREDGQEPAVFMDDDSRKVTLRTEDESAMDRVLAGGAVESNVSEKAFEFDGVFDNDADQKARRDDVGGCLPMHKATRARVYGCAERVESMHTRVYLSSPIP